MQETRVRSLGREDPLEKEMATYSSTLAWRIPWREEPGRLQSMGSQRVRHDFTFTFSKYRVVSSFILQVKTLKFEGAEFFASCMMGENPDRSRF